jgi:hypothetical protein
LTKSLKDMMGDDQHGGSSEFKRTITKSWPFGVQWL